MTTKAEASCYLLYVWVVVVVVVVVAAVAAAAAAGGRRLLLGSNFGLGFWFSPRSPFSVFPGLGVAPRGLRTTDY